MALNDITGLQPTTNGVTNTVVFRYEPTLPSLTPQQQEALMSRRRAATRQYGEVSDTVERETTRANAQAALQRDEIARLQRERSRSGMATLAGRGVARGPMYVNPLQRGLAEEAQRQTTQLEMGLAGTLENLQSALRQADIDRERSLAEIDFQAGGYRSDVNRILGG